MRRRRSITTGAGVDQGEEAIPITTLTADLLVHLLASAVPAATAAAAVGRSE